ncbi:hypothetical protein CC2G_012376 [Coprinopsis cinerea AmutBmut pab1-1]|nr:hypothetical protein CC2G_012376 [Coprinopsis cinerea AmutBmut pab1-1]
MSNRRSQRMQSGPGMSIYCNHAITFNNSTVSGGTFINNAINVFQGHNNGSVVVHVNPVAQAYPTIREHTVASNNRRDEPLKA